MIVFNRYSSNKEEMRERDPGIATMSDLNFSVPGSESLGPLALLLLLLVALA
jgi:hypothetical protein